jgi:hypothetical protein
MTCKCRDGIKVSPVEKELARRLDLDPDDVHNFMDAWQETARFVSQEERRIRREKLK